MLGVGGPLRGGGDFDLLGLGPGGDGDVEGFLGEGGWSLGRSRSMELTALAVVNGLNAVVISSSPAVAGLLS